ncbi:hypothetical protein J437_LFUL018192 [Ladona fulva]|uniref:Integrase zinc-binding domain-containing protein n=1 Tax=Ladona fulva TaxID=123851 RepID=A0A8K0KN07_LADFU|nr:hypothetical protein J437_LFUL018192 [Ladona fulva]
MRGTHFALSNFPGTLCFTYRRIGRSSRSPPLTKGLPGLILKEQENDEFCQKILKELDEGRHSQEFGTDDDGLLYRGTDSRHEQLVAPLVMRNRILRAFHDAPWVGHMGVNKTLASVHSRYWWVTI